MQKKKSVCKTVWKPVWNLFVIGAVLLWAEAFAPVCLGPCGYVQAAFVESEEDFGSQSGAGGDEGGAYENAPEQGGLVQTPPQPQTATQVQAPSQLQMPSGSQKSSGSQITSRPQKSSRPQEQSSSGAGKSQKQGAGDVSAAETSGSGSGSTLAREKRMAREEERSQADRKKAVGSGWSIPDLGNKTEKKIAEKETVLKESGERESIETAETYESGVAEEITEPEEASLEMEEEINADLDDTLPAGRLRSLLMSVGLLLFCAALVRKLLLFRKK